MVKPMHEPTVETMPPTKPVAAAPRARNGFSRTLDSYFSDISGERRLTAEEEVAAARALRAARVVLWEALLQLPAPTLRAALLQVHAEDDLPPAIRRLRTPWPKTLHTTLATLDRDHLAARALTEQLDTFETTASTRAQILRAAATLQALRDRFIAANLGLVVSLARRYERRLFTLADLIQEGNAGLLKAADRFDPERGYRFSTYAVWWIRHAIGRALSDRGREIRLPVHVAERQQTLLRARTQLETKLGRAPTVKELAEHTQFSPERVEELLAVEYKRAVAHDPQTQTAGALAVDSLPAPAEPVEDRLDAEVFQLGIRRAMRALPAVERDVLTRRYGLDGETPMTLREVGALHDLSRERIRQLQVRALRTMRDVFSDQGLVA